MTKNKLVGKPGKLDPQLEPKWKWKELAAYLLARQISSGMHCAMTSVEDASLIPGVTFTPAGSLDSIALAFIPLAD